MARTKNALEMRTEQAFTWRWAKSSVQGRSHEENGQPCQDSTRVQLTSNGALIAAVADGAGSATRAEEGSNIAVESLVNSIAWSVESPSFNWSNAIDILKLAFFDVVVAISEHAREQDEAIAAFHTTLACALLVPSGTAIGHIGDSAIVVEHGNGLLETLALPEHGEYVNSTYFVTQLPQLIERLHIRTYEYDPSSIALTTDGLLELGFDDPYGTCTPWQGFFTPLFDRVRSEPKIDNLRPNLEALLRSPKIRDLTSDDVSLIVAVRVPQISDPLVNSTVASRPRFSDQGIDEKADDSVTLRNQKSTSESGSDLVNLWVND